MKNSETLMTNRILFGYTLGAFVSIILYRMLVPQESVPLQPYELAWLFNTVLIDFITIFPALVLSAIIAPFGFKTFIESDFNRFSASFFKNMTKPLISIVVSVTLYALLSLLVLPLVKDAQYNMRLNGQLFDIALQRSTEEADREAWREAAHYMASCEKIWPQSPKTEQLRERIRIGLDSLRHVQEAEKEDDTMMETASGSLPLIPGRGIPLDAAEAIQHAKTALQAKHYFDAHWLATLAERLAPENSPEATEASLVASQAWNAVGNLEPTEQESLQYRIFRRKREGYNALVSSDWIRSYYIFKELESQVPDDPDVQKYLAMAEAGTRKMAFFADEIELSVGEIHTDAVFSLPRTNTASYTIGRNILSIDSLSLFRDFSYGTGIKLLVLDESGNQIASMKTAYTKIVPFNLDSADEEGKIQKRTIFLLKALDREDETLRWDPTWTGSIDSDTTQLVLDISYEDFLLASRARRGVNTLGIPDLYNGARRMGSFGFAVRAFKAELLYRVGDPVAFLSLAVFMLIMGWRYRARQDARFISFPMLLVLPFILSVAVNVFRLLIQIISLSLVLFFSYTVAMILFMILNVLLFFSALVFLAGQRS